ncbi:TetR family transcriptional regulator [Paraburkholderia sp. BL23I1N1]|nr:TetR family transcriptional regulator [Paraburkholderia sp. BL23I1N1]
MNTAKKLRRSPEGGYARGDETRQRIIEAAIELFGEHGFEGASTRDIAARAGVNAPALQYYFENKEGVYRACAEALADDAWKIFGPAIEHAREALLENANTAVLIDAFIRIQEAIADGAFAKVNNPGPRLFFRARAGWARTRKCDADYCLPDPRAAKHDERGARGANFWTRGRRSGHADPHLQSAWANGHFSRREPFEAVDARLEKHRCREGRTAQVGHTRTDAHAA